MYILAAQRKASAGLLTLKFLRESQRVFSTAGPWDSDDLNSAGKGCGGEKQSLTCYKMIT